MEIHNVLNLISALLTATYLYTVGMFGRGWNKIPYFLPTGDGLNTSVTIIVAARNEEANIRKTLEALTAQKYPLSLFEILVVNDHSTDSTADIVSEFATSNVRLINFTGASDINSYKKIAIEKAILASAGELIVTTDADCTMGQDWLSTIVSFYEKNQFKMISSPVVFYNEKSFFEHLQTLEFLYLIGMGASTIGNKKPSTCNGANLAYQKKTFLEVGGYKGIDDLASGDDELLLHKIASKYPNGIGFLKNRNALVYTYAKPSLEEFIQQRKRWASKTTHYKNKGVIALAILIWIFNVSIVFNVIGGIFYLPLLLAAVVQLIFKMTIEFYFLNKITGFVERTKLLALIPILSILHIIYLFYIGLASNGKKYKWKGRLVR